MGIRQLFAVLVACACTLATPARANWREASSEHFVVYADESSDEILDFTRDLEKFDQALRLQRGITEPTHKAQRVTIYVLPDQNALRRVYGSNGWLVGGFYIPRASGPVAYVTPPSKVSTVHLDGQVVLLHEYSHHFMFLHFPGAYPAWLVEGFAELNSTAKFERDGSVSIGLYDATRAHTIANTGVRVQDLFAPSGLSGSQRNEGNYAVGWALTHYLTFGKKRPGQLEAYVRALNNGATSLDAAHQAFGDLSKLGLEVQMYARGSIPYITMPAARFTTPQIAVRTLSDAEDAALDVQLRADRGIARPERARALLPDARKIATAWPDDPTAQSVLAQVEFWAGDDAEAIAAADRALKADPGRMRALIYKARALMREAEKSHGGPAAWAAARQPVIAANRLDPSDPMPLLLYYRSYAEPGLAVPKAAVDGLYSAAALAPYDDEVTMVAARRLAMERDLKLARTLLARMAFSPHARQPNRAADIVALIDAGKPIPEILAAFSRKPDASDDD